PAEGKGGGHPCESFHALSSALMRSVLFTRTRLAPTEGNSSIRSAKGIWLEKPDQAPPRGRADWRASGHGLPLLPVQVIRRVPVPATRALAGSPSYSMNSGSSVISLGEIVVNMRVR